MVRSHNNSTIISYHPSREHRSTTASSLHSRLYAVGHSVYWNNIFAEYDDPTFVFMSLLWYALYAWDEALEVLYAHICWVVSDILSASIRQSYHIRNLVWSTWMILSSPKSFMLSKHIFCIMLLFSRTSASLSFLCSRLHTQGWIIHAIRRHSVNVRKCSWRRNVTTYLARSSASIWRVRCK